jgi:hypothetical protein
VLHGQYDSGGPYSRETVEGTLVLQGIPGPSRRPVSVQDYGAVSVDSSRIMGQ